MRSEVDELLAYLNKNRDAIVRKLDGVSEDQLRKPMVPSGTSLIGLVQHLTAVEAHWIRLVFNGEKLTIDKTMQVPADISSRKIIDAYRHECARCDDIVRAAPGPETLAQAVNPGENQLDPLRSILIHLIEETARHAGHADIIRENIDGATGT